MTVIKLYCVLFLLSVLALQPLYASPKYLLPLLPFVIIFVARRMGRACRRHSRGNAGWAGGLALPRTILLAFLLCNVVYIGIRAVRQVKDNVAYAQGSKYAGYPLDKWRMFVDYESIKDMPDIYDIETRKPELLYMISGKKSNYPKGVVR